MPTRPIFPSNKPLRPDGLEPCALAPAADAGCHRKVRHLLAVLLVATAAVSAAEATDSDKLELENGAVLHIAETAYSRNLPWVFYDQAIASIPLIHPDSVFVAKQRLATTQENDAVFYSLVAYKIENDDSEVILNGIATIESRAWSFEIMVTESSLAQTLRLVLRRLSHLPRNPQRQSAAFQAAPLIKTSGEIIENASKFIR